jgi:hypothetical protein
MRWLFMAFIALLLPAYASAPDTRTIDPQGQQIAAKFLAELSTGQFGAAKARLDPKLRGNADAALPQIRDALPAASPRLIDSQSTTFTSFVSDAESATSKFTYAMDADSKHALVVITTQRDDKGVMVTDIGITDLKAPPEQLARFSLADKPPGHFVFLAAMAATLGIIIAALVALVRAKGTRRRWLWALAIVMAVGKVSMNWVTGELAFTVGNLQLLGIAAVQPNPAFPWILSFGLPVGALIFLWRQRRPAATA